MYIYIVRGVKVAEKGISGFPVGILWIFATGGIWGGGWFWGQHPQAAPNLDSKNFFEKIL